MKKIFCNLLVFALLTALYAEEYSEESYQKKKSLPVAFFSSLVVPGAGQFYVAPSIHTWQGWMFLAIEAVSWGTYFHFTTQGDDKTDEYKAFADTYYSRPNQITVQDYVVQADGDSLPGA